MPRKQKKYHIIYKTTNLLNSKFYIGMHSTNDLNDGYLGSGTRLRYSIKKYGIENHSIQYLEFLNDRESLCNREKEIVNEILLKDPSCMNLTFGGLGCGDWKGPNQNSDIQRTKGVKGNQKMKWLRENDKIWTQNMAHNISEGNKKAYQNGRIPNLPDWTGKKHKEETKEKMRNHKGKQKGIKNSQFGTCWITNGIENKKIQKDINIPNGWKLGRKIF